MGLVSSQKSSTGIAVDLSHREHGKPNQSEFTVVKVEAYNAINAYLSELSITPTKTLEDVVSCNNSNKGIEGSNHGDTAAFPIGQVRHNSFAT